MRKALIVISLLISAPAHAEECKDPQQPVGPMPSVEMQVAYLRCLTTKQMLQEIYLRAALESAYDDIRVLKMEANNLRMEFDRHLDEDELYKMKHR